MRYVFAFCEALLICSMVSCAWLHTDTGRESCSVVPLATAEIGSDIDLRARAHFEVGKRDVHIEVVARSLGDELIIVGIAEFGVRIFALRQQGEAISVDATTHRNEHLARWTMDALHRSLWIGPPIRAGSDPVVSWVWEDEQVAESGEPNNRVREFSRTGVPDPVRVLYRGHAVEIRNPWCDYRAVIAFADKAGHAEDGR